MSIELPPCSLKRPAKASLMSLSRKAHTADAPIEFTGVENVAYSTRSSPGKSKLIKSFHLEFDVILLKPPLLLLPAPYLPLTSGVTPWMSSK